MYYYDVNSLYPYVALQDLPGLECSKIDNFGDNVDICNLFGFYYCEIETSGDKYLGVLPVTSKFGIYFPLGKWKGWYFSEKLKFAKKYGGYKIKVIKGYNFSRAKDVFKKYIDHIYNIKANPANNTQKSIAKSLLNNLLGRFGIRLDKSVTKIVSDKNFDILCAKNKIVSYKPIANDKILVTYIPLLDPDIIESNKLDITKIAAKYKDEESKSADVTCVPISAAVTAYGRIHISKIKLDILAKGDNIFYSDTDSIVTDEKLSEDMVNSKQIGKIKLEHEISNGIFISGKTYTLITKENKIIKKAKGIKTNSLVYDDYFKLLTKRNVNTALKTQSTKNWELGEVKIEDIAISMDYDCYNKREKIFDSNEWWIDTKPVVINEFDKSLIKYDINKFLILYQKVDKSFILCEEEKSYIWDGIDKSFILISEDTSLIIINEFLILYQQVDKSFIPYIEKDKSFIPHIEKNKSLILYYKHYFLTLYEQVEQDVKKFLILYKKVNMSLILYKQLEIDVNKFLILYKKLNMSNPFLNPYENIYSINDTLNHQSRSAAKFTYKFLNNLLCLTINLGLVIALVILYVISVTFKQPDTDF